MLAPFPKSKHLTSGRFLLAPGDLLVCAPDQGFVQSIFLCQTTSLSVLVRRLLKEFLLKVSRTFWCIALFDLMIKKIELK